jgi:hypothetical protein
MGVSNIAGLLLILFVRNPFQDSKEGIRGQDYRGKIPGLFEVEGRGFLPVINAGAGSAKVGVAGGSIASFGHWFSAADTNSVFHNRAGRAGSIV